MNVRVLILILVVVMGGLAFIAWQQNSQRSQLSEGSPEAGDGAFSMPQPGQTADPAIAWDTPARWASHPSTGMRLATYVVPGTNSAKEAQCAVYYFGPGQGGSVEANMQRWIGEFSGEVAPERSTEDIGGIRVSRVEVSGDYQGHSMGGDSGGDSGPEQSSWALLGAIAEGPNGSVFYKLTGPPATIASAEREFDEMLASLTKK